MTDTRRANAIERALAACRLAAAALDDQSLAEIDAPQRDLCIRQIGIMTRQLSTGSIPAIGRRASGMAQMAADQWDPMNPVTSAVIDAERKYLDIP
jgi:hypothetical protein